jgi:NAD(P)-dependent dehydrogenase (short-subunit alcohol dehydrogenase family)
MPGLMEIFVARFNLPKNPTASFTGQNVIVTGANTGVGYEAALKFVSLGATKVILAVRDLEKGNAAKDRIEKSTKRNDCVEVWELDMLSYDSVKAFASRAETLDHLDVVILNAAVMRRWHMESKFGWEYAIQVNTLSTTLLTLLLLPKLKSSNTGKGQPTLVIVSSDIYDTVVMKSEEVDYLDQFNTAEGFDMVKQYSASKLFIMAAVDKIANAKSMTNVKILTVGPGACKTDLNRDYYDNIFTRIILWLLQTTFFRSAEEGARSYVSAVTDGESGSFHQSDKNLEYNISLP